MRISSYDTTTVAIEPSHKPIREVAALTLFGHRKCFTRNTRRALTGGERAQLHSCTTNTHTLTHTTVVWLGRKQSEGSATYRVAASGSICISPAFSAGLVPPRTGPGCRCRRAGSMRVGCSARPASTWWWVLKGCKITISSVDAFRKTHARATLTWAS